MASNDENAAVVLEKETGRVVFKQSRYEMSVDDVRYSIYRYGLEGLEATVVELETMAQIEVNL